MTRSASAREGIGVDCAIRAHAVVRAGEEALSQLRRNPGSIAGQPLPAGLLKHADEQTVAGLAAVLQACERALVGVDFTDWGVLATPCFLGRVNLAHALERFAEEGAWGVSPHIIPHRSLHSISGTVSQALKIHGPNFGVGGGPDGAAKAMLAAASFLASGVVPGIWLVLTGWNWEPGIKEKQQFLADQQARPAVCSAAAMALMPQATDEHTPLSLLISPEGSTAGDASFFGLEALCDALDNLHLPGTRNWKLGCGGALQLTRAEQTEHRKAA